MASVTGLVACCLVSKAWLPEVLPLLYRFITIGWRAVTLDLLKKRFLANPNLYTLVRSIEIHGLTQRHQIDRELLAFGTEYFDDRVRRAHPGMSSRAVIHPMYRDGAVMQHLERSSERLWWDSQHCYYTPTSIRALFTLFCQVGTHGGGRLLTLSIHHLPHDLSLTLESLQIPPTTLFDALQSVTTVEYSYVGSDSRRGSRWVRPLLDLRNLKAVILRCKDAALDKHIRGLLPRLSANVDALTLPVALRPSSPIFPLLSTTSLTELTVGFYPLDGGFFALLPLTLTHFKIVLTVTHTYYALSACSHSSGPAARSATCRTCTTLTSCGSAGVMLDCGGQRRRAGDERGRAWRE